MTSSNSQPSHVRYKWTYANREAIHGITDYPQIGRWSERRTPLLCASGWHVPTNDMLSCFISTELWEVRVKGAHVAGNQKEAWEYIRFVRKVKAWNDEGRLAFIKFCRPKDWQSYAATATAATATAYAAYAAAAAATAYAAYAAATAYAAAAAYATAYAAAAYAAARKSQSEWLMQNIILKGL